MPVSFSFGTCFLVSNDTLACGMIVQKLLTRMQTGRQLPSLIGHTIRHRHTVVVGTFSRSRAGLPICSLAGSLSEQKIIIYSKDDCPLCDGLKDKISGILDRAPFTGSALNGFEIEVRDIKTNSTWDEQYAMQVPVMAVELQQGGEVRPITYIMVSLQICNLCVPPCMRAGNHPENLPQSDSRQVGEAYH